MASGAPDGGQRDGGRLLIVGGDSMIGRAMAAYYGGRGWRVQATTRRRSQVDAAHPFLDLTAPLDDLPPADMVILAAAAARIGDCEADPAATRRVNVDGTLAVARHMAGHGSHILLLSTDKVFDGTVARRDRTDRPCPACAYGKQKAAAEAGILALGEQGTILRLSKVVEPGLDLLSGWTADLAAGKAIAPFHDLYLAPVPVEQVARLAGHILRERRAGIYHCTGAEDRSYVDLARILAAGLGADPALVGSASCEAVNVPAAARARHTTLEMTVEQDLWELQAPDFETTAREIIAPLL